MSSNKVNKAATELFVFTLIIFVLLLSVLNIKNYFTPIKVLGVKTEVNSKDKFWEDFLVKNPKYVPGWIELGRMDKAREIDPNWVIDKSE